MFQSFLCLPHIVEVPAVRGHKELTQGADTQADQPSKNRELGRVRSALPDLPHERKDLYGKTAGLRDKAQGAVISISAIEVIATANHEN